MQLPGVLAASCNADSSASSPESPKSAPTTITVSLACVMKFPRRERSQRHVVRSKLRELAEGGSLALIPPRCKRRTTLPPQPYGEKIEALVAEIDRGSYAEGRDR